jgi:hypothetical protein
VGLRPTTVNVDASRVVALSAFAAALAGPRRKMTSKSAHVSEVELST